MKKKPQADSENRDGLQRRWMILFLILVVAFALRAPGIVWELPGELHTFSYHPDELPVLGASAQLDPLGGQLDPGFYNYGTLQIYLLYVPVALSISSEGLNLWMLTLLGRLLTVIFALGTVAVCWFAGERISGLAGAVTASVFIVLAPLHVQQSQFVTVDVPSTFWVSLVLLAVISTRFAWSGFFTGLAAATKYTTGLVIFAPLAGILLQKAGLKPAAKLAGIVVILSTAGFLVGCPGAILWTGDFLRDLGFEIEHSRTGHGLVFLETGPGWLYHLLHSLLPGLGWPLLLLALSGWLFCLIKGDWRLRAVCVYALILFVVLASSEVRFARYTLPLYPAFAIVCAGLFQMRRKDILAVVVGVVMVFTAVYAVMIAKPFADIDPRTQAAVWIKNEVVENASIGFVTPPWFYSPPLSRGFGHLRMEDRKHSARETELYDILIADTDWDVSLLDENPDYIVMSNYEYQDRKRLGDTVYKEFMGKMEERYDLAAEFGGDPPVRLFSLMPSLPHDMQYVSPRILIYERKG